MRTVIFFAFSGMQTLDLVGPLEVFATASLVAAAKGLDGYQTVVASVDGRPVTTSSGLTLATTKLLDADKRADTLVLPGGAGIHAARSDSRIVDWTRTVAAGVRRVASVCTGAFLAAQAGLLDGCVATTHWASADQLAREFPSIVVDPDPIFVRSSAKVWTAAGVTAGIDLALSLVEEDHGTDVAQTVARWLVLHLRRPGGQTQFAAPVWVARAKREPIRAVQDAIDAEPGGAQSICDLARRVDMSPRHFTRGVHRRGRRVARRLRGTGPHRGGPPPTRADRRHRGGHRGPLRLRHCGNHAPQLHSTDRRVARPLPENIRLKLRSMA